MVPPTTRLLPLPDPHGVGSAQSYQSRHLLALPGDVLVDELETLALSRFGGARWDAAPAGTDPLVPPARTVGPGQPGVLRTSRHTTLTGPYAPSGAGLPPGTEMVFDVVCPRERGEAPYPGGGDRDGIARAFPGGMPAREEERVVAWLVATARRLGGSLRTDVGNPAAPAVVLTPDPGAAIDMTLYSDVWLDPDAARAVVARLHPRVTLATEGRSYGGPPRGIGELPLYPGEQMDPELRRAIHARADDVDIAALTTGTVLDGYGLLVDLAMDGMVAVEVGGEDRLPLLLRALPWASQGAVCYRVRWEPRDLVESQQEHPSLEHRVARKRAGEAVAAITRTLHAAAGGEIADESEFLVEPEDL
ncbi:hypothetical protein [Cellulosimicrobium arenosum]|uniref:Uncharacterized protein n=1 Tax=Cellulosimicrobium arenosum TaxID=2708133 RepID=A0A927PFR7_9MICO|nr:hypothetical protein [Cellulosimicrobium arenosum]MBD8079895.1 hypothetical protein [Cellulosimicrobium arenosum]